MYEKGTKVQYMFLSIPLLFEIQSFVPLNFGTIIYDQKNKDIPN